MKAVSVSQPCGHKALYPGSRQIAIVQSASLTIGSHVTTTHFGETALAATLLGLPAKLHLLVRYSKLLCLATFEKYPNARGRSAIAPHG